MECVQRIQDGSGTAMLIQYSDQGLLTGLLAAGDACDPFVVGPVRMKLPVQQIFVLVCLLAHLNPFSVPHGS